MFLSGLRAFSDSLFLKFREDMPMAKTITHPKIEVQPVYLGGRETRYGEESPLPTPLR